MLRVACGTDLIRNAVLDALGEETGEIAGPEYRGYIAEVILHASCDGVFKSLDVAADKQRAVIETDLWVSPGDKVCGFKGANNAVGTLVLRFDTREELEDAMSDITSWCNIVTE